jgi:GTP cyclohydrolase I
MVSTGKNRLGKLRMAAGGGKRCLGTRGAGFAATPALRMGMIRARNNIAYKRMDIDEGIEGTADTASYAALVHEQLALVGEDPGREGLLRTPERVAKAMQFLTRGYHERVEDIVGQAIFQEEHRNMVMVRDIELYSLCEHHMLPFFGKAHVAYIPDGRIVGLSKLPRLVDVFARRLQVQERLTEQVAEAIEDVLAPLGVGVVIEAYHLCMMMRGVEKQNSRTITSALRGVFRDDARTREEFLSLAHARLAV